MVGRLGLTSRCRHGGHAWCVKSGTLSAKEPSSSPLTVSWHATTAFSSSLRRVEPSTEGPRPLREAGRSWRRSHPIMERMRGGTSGLRRTRTSSSGMLMDCGDAGRERSVGEEDRGKRRVKEMRASGGMKTVRYFPLSPHKGRKTREDKEGCFGVGACATSPPRGHPQVPPRGHCGHRCLCR